MDIRILCCTGSLLLVTNTATSTEIMRWVDQDGQVHFGNYAPHTANAIRVKPEIITTAPASNNSLKDIMRPGERRMIKQYEQRGKRLIKAKKDELKKSKLSKRSSDRAKNKCDYHRRKKDYLERRLREGNSRSEKNRIEERLAKHRLQIKEYCN